MAGNTLNEFSRKLIELSNVLTADEVYSTLISAINEKLHSTGSSTDIERVKEIQVEVEKVYKLKSGALINSFRLKDRNLTEPKLVWVIVCLHVFDGDRSKVEKLIGNGLTHQKVYTCSRELERLDDKIPHEKKIREIFNTIIKSYE